ncbi:unnamed protein product [Prunus armeniaca]
MGEWEEKKNLEERRGGLGLGDEKYIKGRWGEGSMGVGELVQEWRMVVMGEYEEEERRWKGKEDWVLWVRGREGLALDEMLRI